MAFYDYAVPIFLLVFLIICFMAFLWLKQQRDNVQPPVYHKPIVSYTPKRKEGFQSGPGSGSETNLPPTQLELPEELQDIYGEWEVTPQDNYYDDYENNELNAIAIQATKFNNIVPAPSTPPSLGSTLGAFDSETTRIPWDKDNETYNQNEVTWGFVSEQASRSIFLKTYVNEVAANFDKLQQCSQDDPVNFCYKAPLFNVTTTDQVTASKLQVAEAVSQGVGSAPMAMAAINMNLSNFSEVVSSRYTAISSFLGVPEPGSHKLGPVETNNTRVGPALTTATGDRKMQMIVNGKELEVREAVVTNLDKVRKGVDDVRMKFGLARVGLTIGGWLMAPFTGGATGVLAMAITIVGTAIDVFFGVIGGVCMIIEAIIIPIITNLHRPGGVCPDGYQEITSFITPQVLAVLSDYIPLFSFLTLYHPYVCWKDWGKHNPDVKLRLPPKMPAFMSDRSLSLVYHAGWQSGSSPDIPMASNLEIELDTLTPGYQWLSQSDLKDSPNTNEITKWAYEMASLTKTNTSYTGGSRGSNISKIIQVQMCTADTIPSIDGKQCVQKTLQTTSKIPVIGCPAGKTCPTGKICPADAPVDDGYNCWSGQIDPTCTDPQFEYTTTTTWDDKTGYFRVSPSSCNPTTSPNLKYPYSTRITCPPGYQRNGEQDLICHSTCPAKYTADGALCKGPAMGYTRDYKFGTHTMYTTQKFDVNVLKDLSDVKVPYCDFSKPSMLNKMAQFYNSNSLLNPTINEDGTIQIQVITRFFGVIASSELSCDVACTIEFITYDPITGGKYSVKVGCTYEDDDPEFEGLSFCYRRFYFIRVGTEPVGEFTVTGCTNTNYNSPDGKCLSYNEGANLLVGLYPPDAKNMTKKFDLIKKENVSIVDWDNYNEMLRTGVVQSQQAIGAALAGLSIVASIYGAKGGVKLAATLAQRSAVRVAAQQLTAAGTVIRTAATSTRATGGLTRAAAASANGTSTAAGAARAAGKASDEATELSRNVMSAINKGADDSRAAAAAAADLGEEATEESADVAARTAGIEAAEAGGLSNDAAKRLVASLMKNARLSAYAAGFAGIAGGVGGGVGAGLLISMKLDEALQKTVNGAKPLQLVDTLVGTNVFGSSRKDLIVMTNQNWWKVNHGKIYELSEGFVPTLKHCQITSMGDKVPVSSNYCRNKYIVRNMVNMYHNTYQNAHIKEIIEIEPRGTNGCYYKWNEVEYIPTTNTEGVVLTQKEMIMTNEIKDLTTCTYRPTGLTDDINNSAYKVRSYVDASTASTPKPRIVYPTRSLAFTSDLYARYVRVRPPLSGTGGSGTDGFLNLGQICVFDCSGFNISTGKNVFATSLTDGAADATSVVSGSITVGDSLETVWQPATTGLTEYWELDLSGTSNISELVYFGGVFPEAAGRNKGVRIEFLYTNDPNDVPTYTYTLPTDDATQIVNLYSSSFMKPMYPLGGPIKIPRPINPGTVLGGDRGCANKCQDRSVIDSLISQYNNLNDGKSSIVKILRAITPSSSSCEYEAQVLTKHVPKTDDTPPKNSLTNQILSMEVSPSVSAPAGGIKARYLKVRPSFTPGTVLEFSKILITGVSGTARPYITAGATNTRYNMSYQLEEIAYASGNSDNYLKFLTDPTTSNEPASYPKIFRAGSNDPLTFFLIDLTRNYDIYDITFVGAADRIRGGIIGIQLELYSDQPGATDYTPFDGVTYEPVYRYTLPTDDVKPARIVVAPAAKCTFTLAADGVKVLKKSSFLQPTSPPLSAIDTSGGVFGFSSVIDAVGSAWNRLLPINPTGMATDITNNAKQTNEIVNKMLDTISANKTLLDTNKNCKSPEVLARIMTAYNIEKGPKDTDAYAVRKNTMTRILKSGQSTANTCDVLFENLEELYEDYTVDITDKESAIKTVKAARFKFTNVNNVPVPDRTSIEYDISSNALGLITDGAALSPLYSGPSSSVDCRSLAVIDGIKRMASGKRERTANKETLTSLYTVEESFQTTPLSCEYAMKKVIRFTDLGKNVSVNTQPITTYLKALFTLDNDGYTIKLASAKEYDPNDMDFAKDGTTKLNGIVTILPSILYYDFRNDKNITSSRIIVRSQKI